MLEAVAESVAIDNRYRGFERVAQGGYTSGLLAGFLDGGSAQVKLRGAVPMGRPLTVEAAAERAELRDEESVLAEATPAELAVDPPAAVAPSEAKEAAASYPGHSHHPFPGCFCCGPDREAGDGLRIFPGLLPGRAGVAAPWTPAESHADEAGAVRPAIVWAAFDCPQLWALMLSAPDDSTDHVVTAGLATELRTPIRVGETYTVLAWPSGGEGRRLYADAAIFSSAGEVVAVSRQTAVITGAGVPLGIQAISRFGR